MVSMGLMEIPVSGYSPDGKLFALINNQGILTIWDTETSVLKQEYTPNLHLSIPCTSLVWIGVRSKKRAKGRKSIDDAPIGNYIALGTSKGGIALYSYASGKIERNLTGEGHSKKVNGIAYDNSKYLYTCGDDCQVVKWSVPEEKEVLSWRVGNERPHSIAYLAGSKSILVGCRQIKMYTIDDQKLVQTFTGHTSEVTILKCLAYNNIEYAISGSKMDRVFSIWRLQTGSKNQNTISTLLLDDVAFCASCEIEENGNMILVAVTKTGKVHYYSKKLDSLNADKPISPKLSLEIASDSSSVVHPIPAVTVSLAFSGNSNEILLGYGKNQFLFFEKIILNFLDKRQVLIRNDTIKTSKTFDNNLKHVTPIVNPNDVKYNTSDEIHRKGHKTIEMPLENRLQNLSMNKGELPQAKSKVQLLIQGLHSSDRELLRKVLSIDDPEVIELTVQKLPIQYIDRLLNELKSYMTDKSFLIAIAAAWLKVLIKVHSSQLMALGRDNLLEKFGVCLGVIEHRISCLPELTKLSGRLELLVNQIKQNTDEEHFKNDNALVYMDEDSSNSDMEEQRGSESSENVLSEESDSEEDVDMFEKDD